MPILNVKVSARRSPEMTRKIAATLLELTSRILGKDPNVTAIAIDYVAPEDWIVGGQSLAAQGRQSVYFDIKVTDETNTKAEKAQYIAEAFEAFSRLLGNLHEESYIYIQDVRAASYGYGGKTQEYRFQHTRDVLHAPPAD
ncbi:4-oxalocrotonate tautomerase family protein (plasmid) [Ralstonia solanacearum]|uniref:4-oxalocrotonate tautomerase family protein n=1 Tax=Ralstonia solanacearum TaxID=305 RepID=A0A0S4WUN0_RALSL|nr:MULTISPECIES: 4-oxalocrotonate tautomerase family protein [Ralstonia]QIK25817.1 4-oxalocrotonate tautomerase family protein [Ralstonia solanacearum]ASL75868.1 4-oxalocrotonate tautomerase [Ralstonia pseudosolanacearum]MCK4117476.1 4-oxalocrotonate tautomerase family protein [Ralstonia pseudosolanacearum]QIK30552.1 4-oxalocrotonate tautomerase family protein [Ralstonia solanacearum]QIK36478.1 4-oxalocrotonate tautomerase family protein [Ralstonia solanacearum]